jgi:transaldolase
LDSKQDTLERKLDPAKAAGMDIQKIPMDQATFEKMHAEDRMAHDKLKEGIEGFSKALEDLEKLLAKRLSEISEKQMAGAH